MTPLGKQTGHGFSLVAFGVHNPVPANLLMAAIIFAGLVFGLSLRREMFPEIRPTMAKITAPYPGASPKEIEEGLILKIEDEIADLDEVEEINSMIFEGAGTIIVEFRRNINDIDDAVNTVKASIDTLIDLPEDSERISITKFEPVLPIISLCLFGDGDEAVYKEEIRDIREDLRSLPGMGNVSIYGARQDEIRVEISPGELLRYQLSLPQVSALIESWMRDIPGGTVNTETQTIRIRTMEITEAADTIRQMVIKSEPDGAVVRLGDIATITNGFQDVDMTVRVNGKFSVAATITNTSDQDAIKSAEMVRAYLAGRLGNPYEMKLIDRVNAVMTSVQQKGYERKLAKYEKKRAKNPEKAGAPPSPLVPTKSASLEAYELGASHTDPPPGDMILRSDLARFIEGRLDLLLRNAKWGALFVFASLLLLLNVRVAMWVMLGLVVSLLGTLAFMSFMDITLNLLTMFGLIVVLGLLVDDAIVVAENIVARHEEGEPALAAAVNGGRQITWPVVATVLTTIVAFIPLRFIEGQIGDFLGFLPIVVSCALGVSLIESLFILPSHMGHSLLLVEHRKPGPIARVWKRYETARDRVIHDRIIPGFGRFVAFALRFRYITSSTALAVWIISIGMATSGRVAFVFFPTSDSEIFIVDLEMPIGTALDRTSEVVARIEKAVSVQPEVTSVETLVGLRLDTSDWEPSGIQTNIAQLYVELLPVEERDITHETVIEHVRDLVGPLEGIKSIRYEAVHGGPGGSAINFAITGGDNDEERMLEAAEKLKDHLAVFDGVYDIADDSDQGQRELQITLLDGAAGLGLTNTDIATQIRGALYGLEPHTFSANREDVDVRVMLDKETRQSLADIENLFIFAPKGQRVPLCEVAQIREGTSYATIRRLNQRRAITVRADINQAVNNPERIISEMQPFIAEIETEYPSLRVVPRGRQLETSRSMEGLKVGFLVASVLIYVILAWLFGSFFQPLAIMLAIPFSIVGVIWGHYILNFEVMILSLIGFVALSGIVANDSLILIEFYNHKRDEGLSVHDALIESTKRRLRPIVLTTLTTVLGLMPLMLEQSFQARFLIPMAISIAFGLMSATFMILVVLPCIILIGQDLRYAITWLWTGKIAESNEV